jgi:hypothetical protein
MSAFQNISDLTWTCLLPFDTLHHFGNRYIQMSQAVSSNAYGFHLSKLIALLLHEYPLALSYRTIFGLLD